VSASDGDLVRGARRGDREAFGQLVQRYQRRLWGLVLMVTRDPGGAEEIAQDAFVRAYTRLERYDAQHPFYPWLATIAVRLAQNWLRDRGRVVRHEGAALDGEHDRGASAEALNALIEDERGRRLWRAVATLTSGERTAVLLYYRDEMAVADIARALGVTRGTIKTLLFRARQHLRERLPAKGSI
jgi:RNA polymerase sigma-70 factor, ECF subfamily